MIDTDSRQQRAKRLRVVAKIIRDGIEDARLTIVQAADAWGISRSTLHRMLAGDDKPRFWAVAEDELGLPRRLLRAVADGNVEAIEQMPDLEPYLRTTILAELAEIDTPNASNPRQSDKFA